MILLNSGLVLDSTFGIDEETGKMYGKGSAIKDINYCLYQQYNIEKDPVVTLENFTSFINETIEYKANDIVLIRYWVTGDIVPVKIKEVKAKNSYMVTFNVQNSLYDRAPDTAIKKSDIVGLRQGDVPQLILVIQIQ